MGSRIRQSDYELLHHHSEYHQSEASDEGDSAEVYPSATWRSLFAFSTREHTPLIAFSCAFALLAGLVVPLQFILLGWIFEAFTETSGAILTRTIAKLCTYMLFLAVISWLLHSLHSCTWLIVGEVTAQNARGTMFKHMFAKDMAWFDTRPNGVAGLLPGVQSDIKHLQIANSRPIGDIVKSISTVSASLFLAFWLSWSLSLVILGTLPIIITILAVLTRRTHESNHRQAEIQQLAMKHASSALASIQTVKSMSAEEAEVQNFTKITKRAGRHYMIQAKLVAMQLGLMRFAMLAMFVQGFWFGTWLVRRGGNTPGEVMTTFWAAFTGAQGFADILPQLIEIEKGTLATSRLKSILLESNQPGVASPSTGRWYAPDSYRGRVEFAEVSFSYPAQPGELALKDVNLQFPAGRMTFVIGKSGCGKSTLGQLLVRFYEVSDGHIYLDGRNITSLNPQWLRRQVSLIEQRGVLFKGTVGGNICLGSLDPTTVNIAEVEDAADFSSLLHTILRTRDGFKTRVGPSGAALSGGQRQRISIAQAKLRDTPVLILDESLSAVDSATRRALMRNIREWRTGKTTIVITHDYDMIEPEDNVYHLQEGKVLWNGTWHSYRQDLRAVLEQQIASHPLESPSETLVGSEYPSGRHRTRFLDRETAKSDKSENHCHPSLWEIVKTTWPCFRRHHKLFFILALCTAAIQAVCTPLFSYALSTLVSTLMGLSRPSESTAFTAFTNPSETLASLAILSIALCDGLATFVSYTLIQGCSERWVRSLLKSAYASLLSQPISFFHDPLHSSSLLTYTMDTHAATAMDLLPQFLHPLLVAIIMFVVAMIWSFRLVIELGLFILTLAPVAYAVMKATRVVSQEWEARCADAEALVADIAAEALTNVRSVRCLTLEQFFQRKHIAANQYAVRIGVKRAILVGIFDGLLEALVLFATGGCFWFGGILVADNIHSVPEVVACFTILLMSFVYINFLMASVPRMVTMREATGRLLRLTRLPEDAEDVFAKSTLEAVGDIDFRSVEFTYPERPEESVMKNLSFRIPQGSYTAIIGQTGCGKSTVANLLLKLYSLVPQPGRAPSSGIFLSGISLNIIHARSLRSLIALVPQSTVLFPGTFAQNICYGNPMDRVLSSQASIEAAADAVGIHSFIKSLARGYDTIIGLGGTDLSGGQLQRIGIARAIFRNPQVLVLDEPTANLDSENTQIVRRLAKRLVKAGKTVIVITHEVEMMREADQILVLDHGRMVEEGKFEQLLARKGKLAELLRRVE